MQLNNVIVNPQAPIAGSASFMDPEKIVGYFGLTEGMRVADFGSGAGFFTILIAKRVGESGLVTAVDIMNSALETLMAKAKADGLGNIQTVRSNLEVFGSSGLANDSQDTVLLANVLFQNHDKTSIINEANRVLKPDGRLVIIGWRKANGGFGPPEDLRMDPEDTKQLAVNNGSFLFSGDIDAGNFHYGLIFKKV